MPSSVQDGNVRVRCLSAGNREQRGVGTSLQPAVINSHSFILKEKLEMKENYDTFGEVLSTLRQEMDTAPSAHTEMLPQVKAEPKVEKQSKLLSLSSSASPINSVDAVCIPSGRHQNTSLPSSVKEKKNISSVTTSLASTSLTGQASSDRLVAVEAGGSSNLTAASSSWTMQAKGDGVAATSSPRILPPGMKIDIKKPSKFGANGIKSPPVKIARGKILSAKTSSAAAFTRLHGQPNGFVLHNTQTPNSIASHSPGESYTDNEKSAAEDLISLKEGLSCNNPVSLLLHQQQKQQQPQLQQLQHHSNPIIVSPSKSLSNSQQNLSFLQSPGAGSRVITLSKQQNHKTNSRILPKGRPSQISTNRSRHASGTSAGQPIIIPESSSIMYAHTLMPTASLSTALQHQNQDALIATAVVDLGKQQSGAACNKPGLTVPNNVKIVSSLQHHPSSSTPIPITSNSIKHKVLDRSVSADAGPSSPKFRTLEPKSEGKKLSSLLAGPAALSSPLFQSHSVSNEVGKSRSAVRHILTTPSISALSIGSSQSASITTIASTTPSSTDVIPYVAIQTPQHSLAASQGTNGAQPALLKLLQQPNHPQQVVVTPKAPSNLINRGSVESSANTISSIQGSRSAMISALSPSVVNQSALDHKGQAVKLIPSNGLDGKGKDLCQVSAT